MRLTNAFSKKLDDHMHALALYFTFSNFTRIHKALKVTKIKLRHYPSRPGLELNARSLNRSGF